MGVEGVEKFGVNFQVVELEISKIRVGISDIEEFNVL